MTDQLPPLGHLRRMATGNGSGHGHRRCFEALERWIRPDNVEQAAALLDKAGPVKSIDEMTFHTDKQRGGPLRRPRPESFGISARNRKLARWTQSQRLSRSRPSGIRDIDESRGKTR